jgi:hypothetical protein
VVSGKKILRFFIWLFVALISNTGSARSTSAPASLTEWSSPTKHLTSTLAFDATHIGGSGPEAVLVDGNYAYVGMGPELAVLDISTPGHPLRVGSLLIPEAYYLDDMVKAGTYLYVVAWNGLHIVDVADATHPTPVGLYTVEGYGYAMSVAVSGNYAYVGYDVSLRVVDISDSRHPLEIGVYADLMGVFDLSVVGSYAYLALSESDTAYNGLAVLDVSNPASPALVTLPLLELPASGIAIAGNYAYLAQDGLRIYDISDPSLPTELGSCDCAGWKLTLQEHYAYIAAVDNGLRVVDISDPSHPLQTGLYDRDPSYYAVTDVAVTGIYAYVGLGMPAGLEIVDISSPANPAKVGEYIGPGQAWDVAVTDDYAYVADVVGLTVVDKSDLGNPTTAGYANISGATWRVAVAGDYAYIAGGEDGLRIFDISDPAQPVQIGIYDTPGIARGVAVAGSYAYVADTWGGVRIIDVINPISPTEAGFIDMGADQAPMDVAIVGKYAYVALTGAPGGFRIVDISDPQHPVLMGGVGSSIPHMGIVVHGRYAYLAAYYTPSLRIWDISNPNLPVFMSSMDTPSIDTYDIDVSGQYVYVADGHGLAIFDVSDPAHPSLVGYYNMYGNAMGVKADGNYIYVAGSNGLYILRALQEEITTPISPAGGSLASAAGDVQLIFPSGALTQTAELTYKRLLLDQDTASLIGIGSTFDISAIYSGTHRQAALAPGETFSLTLTYTSTQLGPVIEDTLALYNWDGSQWVRDASSRLDTSRHVLTAESSQFTLWAVLGETKRIYLPAILR